MARSRGFIPSFDRLGLRITPSDMIAIGPAPEDCYRDLIPDDSDLPGADASTEDMITWVEPDEPTPETLSRKASILASVDWMLPLTTTDN